ncbi:MAG: alpha/beta fold hydrolase [Gallionella sp.]
MTARRMRLISVSAAAIALLYVSGCSYMWATQRDHIFEPELPLQTTPDRLGMQFEELHIPAGSGKDHGELDSWWMPANQTGAPTLLYLHGNHINMSGNLEHTLRLHNFGFNVLLVDYRGFGKSSGGYPSEAKVYEDAEAAWQYLIKQRGVAPGQLFIYGHSLGGAIAIDLAVHHPEAAGLIAESTFTSMADMGRLVYPWLPVHLLLNQRFDSLKKISNLKIPVLLIHGTWDEKVPFRMSQQLYDAAPQPKQLILIKGGEHNNSAAIGLVEYRDTVKAFVKKYTH